MSANYETVELICDGTLKRAARLLGHRGYSEDTEENRAAQQHHDVSESERPKVAKTRLYTLRTVACCKNSRKKHRKLRKSSELVPFVPLCGSAFAANGF